MRTSAVSPPSICRHSEAQIPAPVPRKLQDASTRVDCAQGWLEKALLAESAARDVRKPVAVHLAVLGVDCAACALPLAPRMRIFLGAFILEMIALVIFALGIDKATVGRKRAEAALQHAQAQLRLTADLVRAEAALQTQTVEAPARTRWLPSPATPRSKNNAGDRAQY